MEHIKFAADLGYLVARAKFASENTELEQKLHIWDSVSPEQKKLLLELDKLDRNDE